MLDTFAKFEQWQTSLEGGRESKNDEKAAKLASNLNECEEMLSRLNGILGHLDELQANYEFTSGKTNALHEACEQRLQEQHALIMACEAINSKIAYFAELEQMSKRLASPSPLILTESLVPTLSRLDECIAFLESKPNYKDSESYAQQFRHLQSQALLTTKNHVISSIQLATKSVLPDPGEALSPSDSVFTLFYGKFQQNAHRIKSLMALIEERSDRAGLEHINGYLTECHDAYFAARETLIGPVLSVAVEDMVASHRRNFCSLSRNSSRMLMHINRDEYQLFFQFFGKPAVGLRY